MKKFFLFIFCSIISFRLALPQSTVINGKASAEIFTDFHYLIDDTTNTSGFGLSRAYIGYTYLPGGNFSANIILNVGSPTDLADGSKDRRYAFFREASITWTKDNLTISGGMTTTRSTIFQQKFLNKRYIADNFESINGYAIIADLGVSADIKLNDVFKIDFTLMNGEGYHNLQYDNSLKTSAGVSITPNKNMLMRLYYDISHPSGIWQHTIIGFIGFKNESFTAGLEAAHKTALDKISGHDAWGISGTIAKTILPKTEIFARYDYTSSSTEDGETLNWNKNKDCRFGVIGLQYELSQNLRIAIDYQGIFPYYSGIHDTNAIFVNAHFKL